MRKLITRTIKSYIYTCKAANAKTETFEEIKVPASVILKHPERQLAKLMPEGYTFIRVIGEPENTSEVRAMLLSDFLASSFKYEKQAGDETIEA